MYRLIIDSSINIAIIIESLGRKGGAIGTSYFEVRNVLVFLRIQEAFSVKPDKVIVIVALLQETVTCYREFGTSSQEFKLVNAGIVTSFMEVYQGSAKEWGVSGELVWLHFHEGFRLFQSNCPLEHILLFLLNLGTCDELLPTRRGHLV